MSRAAVAKSRTEKKGGQASTIQTVAHEIIPGKFNDQDWNYMLDKDDGEDFIADAVEDIVDVALREIHKLYIEKQLLPFTISQAKDALLQIIKWQFLARDEGEDPQTDIGWAHDEEPDPVDTDCWAQGSVPKHYVPPPTPVLMGLISAEQLVTVEEEPEVEAIAPEDIFSSEQSLETEEESACVPEETSETSDSDSTTAQDEDKEVNEPAARPKEKVEQVETPRKKGRARHYGPLKSAGVSRITETLHESEIRMMEEESRLVDSSLEMMPIDVAAATMPAACNSILRAQAGRPPGMKDVTYDELGNIVAVMKINSKKLPSHRVNVTYQIVDPNVEAEEARLSAMKTGHFVSPHVKDKKKITPKSSPSKQAGPVRIIALNSGKSQVGAEVVTPLPPPVIENMELSQGVVVKEGERVRKGPSRNQPKSNNTKFQKVLRPIDLKNTAAPLDISTILGHVSPQIRALNETSPIPPIIPTPPPQRKVTS